MTSPAPKHHGTGILDLSEWTGNKLPDPATLFLIGAILVMIVSMVAAMNDWQVVQERPEQVMTEVTHPDGSTTMEPVIDPDTGKPQVEWKETGKVLKAKSLLSRDGIYWAVKSMVKNFTGFAPLGVVLVGMLGIGIAERVGLISALLKAFMLVVPSSLLTPAMVFIGIMSSMTLDAGYVVLPPLAAVLYRAMGRSPLVGIAAVFAGVSAGFNANLFVTGLDPMLSEMTTNAAQSIQPDYAVAATCNWGFMAASTVIMTLVGWGVTSFFVEKRMNHHSSEDGGPDLAAAHEMEDHKIQSDEKRGLIVAGLIFVVTFGIILGLILIPKAPLFSYHVSEEMAKAVPGAQIGTPAELATADPAFIADATITFTDEKGNELVRSTEHFDRWVDAIVPILFFCFIIPAIGYGITVGSIRNDKHVAKLLIESMAAMAPIIVLAFFAAQFIAYFKYSGLDNMLAQSGGQALGKAGLSPFTLMVAFILVTLVFNLFIGSMSAKYFMFAPIFVPMFMMVGIAPELTQATYRIGDSVSNIITPLNAYLIIILVFMQKYAPKSGMGTLISLMLPYTIFFTIAWTIMLMIWMKFGIPLGPGGPLEYTMPGLL